MMKKFSTFMVVAGMFATSVLLNACSKNDDTTPAPAAVTKKFTLYNYSTGSAVEAGSITFTQRPDSNASATINLLAGYRVNGATLPANISTTVSGTALVYSNLASVDGSTGTSTTATVVAASTNLAVKYTTLISLSGYIIKIMSGSNVQAQGVIQ